MPLITLVGYPCSGKTSFGNILKEFFATNFSHQYSCIILINEDTLHMSNRSDNYSNASSEKLVREALKSAVSTSLSVNSIVIVDSLNYIKGFRYELYCIARAMGTLSVTVWVECDNDLSLQWNRGREAQFQYEDLRYKFPKYRLSL